MKITTTVEIPSQRIADLLVGLFENGPAVSPWLGSVTAPDGTFGHAWYSTADGIDRPDWRCTVQFDDPDDEEGGFNGTKVITLADLERALHDMARDYPDIFADVLDENDDANTADIFGQLVVLGEVVYG